MRLVADAMQRRDKQSATQLSLPSMCLMSKSGKNSLLTAPFMPFVVDVGVVVGNGVAGRCSLLVFIGYTKDGVAIGLEALLDTLGAVFGSALQRNLTIGIHIHIFGVLIKDIGLV